MNQHLYVQQPSEAGWRFSLDPTQNPESYAAERRFTTDHQGLPFVDGGVYTLFAYHLESRTRLNYLLVYNSSPEACLLVPISDVPDLHRIAQRGAATSLVLTLGGVQVPQFRTLDAAQYVLVEDELPSGLKAIARYPISKLGGGTGGTTTPVVPRFQIVGHYESAPITAASFQIVAHYEPASVTAPVTAPGKPLDGRASRVGSSGSEAVYTWRLADTLETSVEVQSKNSDGTWTSRILPARTQTLSLGQIGYGRTVTLRVRAANTGGQSPWGDEVTIRITSLRWAFRFYGLGQPPVLIGDIAEGASLTLPSTNANLGLQLYDAGLGTPTTEDYDALTLYVILPDGTRQGWFDPERAAGPAEVPRYLFGRPNGTDLLKPGNYTIVGEAWKGATLIDKQSVTFMLTAVPTKPLAPTALKVVRVNGVVHVEWTDNAFNENYQRLEYRTGSGTFGKLVDLLPDQVKYDTSALNAEGVTYSFRVIAGNTQGESDYSNTAELTPNPPANRPPTMPVLPRQTATVGKPFSYTLPAIGDPDGDQVSLVLTGLGSGITFNTATRTLVGPASATGTLTITVTASDPQGAASSGTLLIDLIAQLNQAPLAPNLPDLASEKGTALTLTLPAFTDPDGDALTYSVPSGVPPGLSFEAATRRVTGTPTGAGDLAQVSYTIRYQATDSRGASTIGQFVWRINAPQAKAPVAPALATLNLSADVPYVDVPMPPFADPQGQALTYTLTDLPEGLTFNASTRRVTGYPETSGQLVATYTATNTAGLSASASQVFRISTPTITLVRGRVRRLSGTDWVLEVEVSTSQVGIIRYHGDRLRNRQYTFADLSGLLNTVTVAAELFGSRSSAPGSSTPATPPGGTGIYYLHLLLPRAGTYTVYAFSLESYYDWSVTGPTEPLAPLPQS